MIPFLSGRWLGKIVGYGQLLLFFLLWQLQAQAQATLYNFRHITTADGLSNGVIRGVAQDKYGYIWTNTVNGLCRYNGYTVKIFLHSDSDSFSVPDNFVQGMISDTNKNLWISSAAGLHRYDYATGHFLLQASTRRIPIRRMVDAGKNIIYCITSAGLGIFNTATGSFRLPAQEGNIRGRILLQQPLNDICLSAKGFLYLATDTGLVVYDPIRRQAQLIPLAPLAGRGIERVIVDNEENTWVSFGENGGDVLRADRSFSRFRVFPEESFASERIAKSFVNTFFLDHHGRLWVATSRAGLFLYDTSAGTFSHFGNNPLLPMSLTAYNISALFQDGQGFIWVGTEGYGLNYFHPDNNLFHAVYPDFNPFVDNWSRAVAEERNGNIWFAGVNGVSRYDPITKKFERWSDELNPDKRIYSNSVRSLLYDDRGYMWIGTAQGLNRYNPATGHMDFFGEKEGMPLSFFWSLLQDSRKNIWIGCRDGLYRFSYATNKFEHFQNDSLLSVFARYNTLTIFEDSHGIMWFGTYRRGMIRYDPVAGTARQWVKEDADTSFINNSIRSFAEDRKGLFWIGTNEGIASYDHATGQFRKYGPAQGLTTLNTSELMVDDNNRLWIGSGKGLFMLDSTRTRFKSFSQKDGLPSLELNEQAAFRTSHGEFIYPALKGFLVFDPLQYKETDSRLDVYISAFRVFNRDYRMASPIEEVKELKLGSAENFFSLELTAINYNNAEQTWYAYKLEPFDKDWVYNKERIITYTNVPGGNYTFHYKASTDANQWDVPEKTIRISVETIFYRTKWFWLLVGLLVIGILYAAYRLRTKQREKIYSLQHKTQALEKEKAIVQYESLKQQLNPHFLFNSLTSLRSLIRINKQEAADFLDKMSLNYRYILKSSESELVALKDELEFARGYCELQQIRLGEGLQVSVTIGEEQLYKKIVPVTIQNMVENAIKHNMIDKASPLLIEIFEEDDYLVVRNNLQLKEFVETSNKYGLKHLQSLYRYLDARPVLIVEKEDYFTVKIPLI